MTHPKDDAFWAEATTIEHTSSVGKMTGLEAHGVAVFRGIPYAEAPTGPLRFAAPERRAHFAEPFDATSWGATPLRKSPGFDIPEPVVPGDDILNLNVFAPAHALNGGAALPVLVWIHGGGYVSGSSIGAWYDGRQFASEDVVVVSISYRLGLDGFGHLEGAPDNRAVLDWICALEWIQDAISSFGGDPANVTVSGQSAGGGAVLCLLATRAARGLFKRAWVLSGVLESITVDKAALATAGFAEAVGVSPDIAGFASVTDTALQEALLATGALLTFPPVVGEELFPHGISAGIAAESGDVALVIGATADETLWTPGETALDRSDIVAQFEAENVPLDEAVDAVERIGSLHELLPGRLITERLFRSVVPAVLSERCTAAAPTWVYDYRWAPEKSGLALHCNEIPVFFGLPEAETVTPVLGTVPAEVAASFHGSALSFVRGEVLDWMPAESGVLKMATGACTVGDARSTPSDGFSASERLAALFR